MEKQFFIEGITNLKQTGSLARSSKYLVDKMLRKADWSHANALELGAGDGVFSKAILQKMGPSAHLTAYEINPIFAEPLSKIHDHRFTLKMESVDTLDNYPEGEFDVILSCLPIANFETEFRDSILQNCNRLLKHGGVFLQYQYFPWDLPAIRRMFGSSKVHFESRNFPPAFFYVCKK